MPSSAWRQVRSQAKLGNENEMNGVNMRKIIKWTFLAILIFLGVINAAGGARAGQSGDIFCTAPGCGYKDTLAIGGGRASPSVTGYCAKDKKFVRVKLKNWADYHKSHKCPGSNEPLQAIYSGSDVSQFPCPKCGQRTLQYKMKSLFD